MDDSALLRQYCEKQSEDAFATLVTRHLNLVYSVALRHTGSPQQAEEITQAVFIIFARKAGGLRHEKALSSWLFRTTVLVSRNLVRSEMRRHQREEEAYMQSLSNEPEVETWQQIAPLLNSAVAALGEKDRQAILLRFFQKKSLSEVGAAMGSGEEAAKKRVSRALEKLRTYFTRRGVHSTTAIIGDNISAHSMQAAPAALAKAVAAVAVAKGVASSASTLTLVKGALKVMAWTKAKTAAIATAVVILAATTGTIAVKFAANHSRASALEMREFTLNENFISNLRQVTRSAADVSPGMILPDYLRSNGVDIQPPGSIAYNDTRKLLSVHSTPSNVNAIERIISQLRYSQQQIVIKAYFLEVPESDVPSVLATGTAINTPNDNSAEIMDDSKMAAVLQLLQSHGVTALGESSIVSLFDRQAQIRVDNNVVNLFPTLLGDGYGIRMKMAGSSQNPSTVEANLWDGQTLALGGPPSDRQTRLFVFASVRMINEVGNVIHSQAKLQSRLGTIPPQ